MSEKTVYPFLITSTSKKISLVVMAASLSLAQSHALSLVTTGTTASVDVPVIADYHKDFAMLASVERVTGGKDDAELGLFKLTLNDGVKYILAASKVWAEKHLEEAVQALVDYSVVPVPGSMYTSIDWAAVQTLETPEAAPAAEGAKKRGRPAKGSEQAAGQEGDAAKQTDLTDIPGMN